GGVRPEDSLMSNRMLAAVAVAGVACAAAAWMGYRTLGGRGELRSAESYEPELEVGPGGVGEGDEDTRVSDATARIDPNASAGGGERRVTRGRQPAAWVSEDPLRERSSFEFVESGSSAEAEAVFTEAFSAFKTRGPSDSALSAPEGGWSSAMESYRRFMQPIIAQDADAFAEVAERLGGVSAEADEDDETPPTPGSSMYSQLSRWLAGASIDLASSEIRRLNGDDPRSVPRLPNLPGGMEMPAGAIPMMEMRNQSTDDAGNTVVTSAINLPMGAVFPRVQGLLERGGDVIEVWTPARMAGRGQAEPDLTLTTMMVRDPSINAWTPAAFRIRLLTEDAQERSPTRDAG
ncbi:MAG: hypothetical protein AAGK04_13855, partial [Planctomycetota bacterium]